VLVWMVLLTSGIVDEGPGWVRGCVSTVFSFGWGRGTSRHGSGCGVLAHCWAVRNHILCPGALVVGVVGLPPSSEARVSVWWVLVGVVVDSWIVDASIL
jgi:hypothetical protein